MIRRPPRSTRTDTLCHYTALFRSVIGGQAGLTGRAVRGVHAGHASPGSGDPGKKDSRIRPADPGVRSEEHTSELQSLMRISYAVFCLKKKRKRRGKTHDRYYAVIDKQKLETAIYNTQHYRLT